MPATRAARRNDSYSKLLSKHRSTLDSGAKMGLGRSGSQSALGASKGMRAALGMDDLDQTTSDHSF